jgi:Uma2 family endonuclease
MEELPMAAQSDNRPRPHRLTVDEYRKMAEVGLLARDLRVELINGEIIDMAPIGSRHAALVNDLARMFNRVAVPQACVWAQSPVVLGSDSEPQPDLSLLRPRADRYSSSLPGAADVLLLVEVSDTTFRYDSGRKLALYATHGIPEVWIVDIEGKKLHVFRSPVGDKYEHVDVMPMPGTIALSQLSSVAVDTSELFRLMTL